MKCLPSWQSWIGLDNVPVHDVCTQTKTPALNRRNIFIRDQYRCQYCAVQMRSSDLTLDHVVPKSKGGKVHHTNITYIHIVIVIGLSGRGRSKSGGTSYRQ